MLKFKDTSDYESKQPERAKRAVSGVSSLNAKDYLGQSSTLLSFISLMSSFFASNFEEYETKISQLLRSGSYNNLRNFLVYYRHLFSTLR